AAPARAGDAPRTEGADPDREPVDAPRSETTVTRPDGATTDRRRRWSEVRAELLDELLVVEEATARALDGTGDRELTERALAAVHAVATDTASHGRGEAAARALSVATHLPAIEAVDDPRILQVCEDLAALRRHLTPPQRDPDGTEAVAGWASLVVYSEDGVWAEQVRREAAIRGLHARSADDIPGLLEVLRHAPDTLVADLTTSHPPLDALLGSVPPASIAVSIDEGLDERLELARVGFGQVLPSDASPRDAVDAATALITGQRLGDARALLWRGPDAVDGPDAGQLAVALRGSAIDTVEVAAVRDAWDVVVAQRPDLLIAMADPEGIKTLCRIVRADAGRSTLPIIALVTEDGSASARLYAAGCDDVLTPTAEPGDVAARARHLIVRARVQQKQADLDPLTGLANEAGGLRAIDRLASVATRQGTPLALGAIQVDGFGRLNELYGRALGDEVLQAVAGRLRHAFRETDVIARLGASEFLVAFHGADRDQAATRLRMLSASLERLKLTSSSGVPIQVTLSAGVAALPTDGRDVQAVRRAAGESLRHARAGGGDRVVAGTVGQDPAAQQLVDVAVIESDQVLAELLLEALRSRGWRTRHIADGQEALQLLTGPHPPVRTRLVLLDVDLPGHDGFTILRRLSEAGTLKETRVIVVTSLVTEAETVAAFEAGANDHVAKPFSLPVLMERVRGALEARP
ncbi:MAG: diguanylate cyclase, partial [Nitriliruptoraceae bacterium]|nr:diguanylate cyclase [Nitriliruptoraceae bacterium]